MERNMLDDLQIAIPSRSRSGVQKTIYNISEELWPNTVIIVPPEQIQEYRATVPLSIELVPCASYGISPTRQFILNMKKTGKLIMADDDLTFYKRSQDGTKFARIARADTIEMFTTIHKMLDDYVIVGLVDKAWSQAQPRGFVECTRFNDLHGYNRDKLPQPWPRFRGMHGEEHDVQLQCITRGYKTAAISEYSKTNHPYAKGGCSDWRTKELMMSEIERMAQQWPGIVIPTADPNHPQGYRVKFNWKEAMRQGGLV
jgi:hypothetical protein